MDQELPVRKGCRLKGYDYSRPGFYFITVCTKVRRENILCWIEAPVGAAALGGPCSVTLTSSGEIVQRTIEGIGTAYPNARIDSYVIMPDHIHFVLVLKKAVNRDGPPRAAAPTTDIPKIVNALKGLSSKRIGEAIWQRSYYDHIIRSAQELEQIRQYMADNPAKWLEERGELP